MWAALEHWRPVAVDEPTSPPSFGVLFAQAGLGQAELDVAIGSEECLVQARDRLAQYLKKMDSLDRWCPANSTCEVELGSYLSDQ